MKGMENTANKGFSRRDFLKFGAALLPSLLRIPAPLPADRLEAPSIPAMLF